MTVSWTDAASVTSYITSILSGVVAIIVAIHPGYSEPAVIQALVPSVGLIVAGVMQVVNVITHRGLQKALIAKSK
jgi:hypothetical protein